MIRDRSFHNYALLGNRFARVYPSRRSLEPGWILLYSLKGIPDGLLEVPVEMQQVFDPASWADLNNSLDLRAEFKSLNFPINDIVYNELFSTVNP